jgi:hypothetical protein
MSNMPPIGTRCVAGPADRWARATIVRANEDGTVTVEFDVKELIVLKYWYGLTLPEISLDDDRLWAELFDQFTQGTRAMGRAEAIAALRRVGFGIADEHVQSGWQQICQRALEIPPEEADDLVLDSALAYQMFLHLGQSAKSCLDRMAGRKQPYGKVYWNQTRMGGRDPAEIARPVTRADTLAALGLAERGVDAAAMKVLQEWERANSIALPQAVKKIVTHSGIGPAVCDCHPNNPQFMPLPSGKLYRGLLVQSLAGDLGLTFLEHHDLDWCFVFEDGEPDARVYLHWQGDDGDDCWQLAAPSVDFFLWDLAQTGLAWHLETEFYTKIKGTPGPRIERNDIGLIRGPRSTT